MLKSSLIVIPATLLAILITGLLSEFCCCASPMAAVVLGLAAGALCAAFEKPARRDLARKRGALAGAIAGAAALPAQVLGQIVVALALAGSGTVDISPLGFPAAGATVEWWNWLLNSLFAAGLYGLTSTAIMAGMGAVGGALWFRVSRKGIDAPAAEPESAPQEPPGTSNTGKAILAGLLMAVAAFVYFLLMSATWGCLEIPAAAILGLITGILAANLARERAAVRGAVFGGIAGAIAGVGSILGDVAGLLIRTFLIQTPQGVNSMTEGLYNTLEMANSLGTRTPAEILKGDLPITCCCSAIFLLAFVGFGALGGFLRAHSRAKLRVS